MSDLEADRVPRVSGSVRLAVLLAASAICSSCGERPADHVSEDREEVARSEPVRGAGPAGEETEVPCPLFDIDSGELWEVSPSSLFMVATDRDNTEFRLGHVLSREHAGRRLQFLCSEHEIPLFGWSSAKELEHGYVYLDLRPSAQARRVAEALGCGIALRKPEAEYRLSCEVTPSVSEVRPLDEVPLRCRITNTGDTPVEYEHGGSTRRAGRNVRFDLRVFLDGEEQLTVRNSGVVSGPVGRRTLQPGESFTEVLDASRWMAFVDPGEHRVELEYEILVLNAEPLVSPGVFVPEEKATEVLERLSCSTTVVVR